MVQLLFAWRIFRLTSNFITTLAIVLCSTIQLRGCLETPFQARDWESRAVSGLAVAVAGNVVHYLADFHTQPVVVTLVTLWLGFAALADIAIAGWLVVSLKRDTTGVFPANDPIIDRIAKSGLAVAHTAKWADERATVAVGTGTLTAFFALLDLVCFLASASTLWAPPQWISSHALIQMSQNLHRPCEASVALKGLQGGDALMQAHIRQTTALQVFGPICCV
jgi:hypothetical protein